MINDHSTGTSCSIHGCSRVNEISECSINETFAGASSAAVAMAPVFQADSRPVANPSIRAGVVIVMCTYNGQGFLGKQLESIRHQTFHDWHVAISDDGSQDETLRIAHHYRHLWGQDKISLWRGPGRGYAQNFMSALCNSRLAADYYAWCDQDDIWDEQKLEVALTWLKSVPESIPALYFGRTRLVDPSGEVLGYSPFFRRPPSFANALVQNIGGGNTMVLNHAARMLLSDASHNLQVVSHDWWAYLLVAGVGGNIFYDPRPYVMYRQHAGNLIGANANWQSRLTRLKMMYRGRFQVWNSINIAGLETVIDHLTHENRALLEHFKVLRTQSLPLRLSGLKRSGIYRQTRLGNLGLILATALGKI